jgi:protein-S-isoprenylcysteine O-methyltransferase Ste14
MFLKSFVMVTLDAKIPPPVVALVVALGIWGASFLTGRLALLGPARFVLAGAFVVVALVFAVPAIRALRKAKTTISPREIDRTTKVVTSGVYAHSRNPIYLALASLLFGWAVFLDVPLGFLGPLFFVTYMNRYQIRPEERVLEQRFGPPYVAYKARVRRWI